MIRRGCCQEDRNSREGEQATPTITSENIWHKALLCDEKEEENYKSGLLWNHIAIASELGLQPRGLHAVQCTYSA